MVKIKIVKNKNGKNEDLNNFSSKNFEKKMLKIMGISVKNAIESNKKCL